MRPSRRRRLATGLSGFEAFEPRIVMSGNPAADVWADYFVENQLYAEVPAIFSGAADLTGLAHVRAAYGFTGQGQTVAVIDTGIAYDHPALGGGFGAGHRVVGGFDFTEERDANPYDDGPAGSHGTHVAGIIASSDANHPGIAPGVDLLALRVFNDAGSGSFGWVEESLGWVHSHRNDFRYPITTVNLSLGADWNSDTPPPWAVLEDDLARLNADGIFVSVAAGNSFSVYVAPGLSYPAASPFVVPVSSVDDNGSLSSFSQRSQRVIAAPGRGIVSTVPDYVGDRDGLTDDFARYSGTSMAAPYVAGASVLLRQAYQFVGIGGVTEETLYRQMYNTADTVYDPATGLDYHRLNLGRAIDAVMLQGDSGQSVGAPGLYDPASGGFYLRNSNDGGWANVAFSYGPQRSDWIPVSGDWNGDGVATVGLYNPATATFYLRNAHGGGRADVTFAYGPAGAGWRPIAGDWNGDGIDTIGLYNPASATFYLKNSNSGGYADLMFTAAGAKAGWVPFAGDFNGDGVDTVGLYDPAAAVFYLKNSHSSGRADVTFGYGPAGAGWTPIAGDWNHDGVDTIGLYNPAGARFFLRNVNSSGYADTTFVYGPAGAGWRPVVGQWQGSARSALQTVQAAPSAAPLGLAALAEANFAPRVGESLDVWAGHGHTLRYGDTTATGALGSCELAAASWHMPYAHATNVAGHAAASGWRVDCLAGSGRQTERILLAGPQRGIDPRAVDGLDLLTAVSHELGDIGGFDLSAQLIGPRPAAGSRHVAGAWEADAVFARHTFSGFMLDWEGPFPGGDPV